jgi:hypothetical protein
MPVLRDRAYQDNQARQLVPDLGWIPVVPPAANRIERWQYDRALYKKRNEVERLFRRLKGFRRIFSRFEKLDVLFIAFLRRLHRLMRRPPGTKPVAGFGKRPVPFALQHLHYRLLDESIQHYSTSWFFCRLSPMSCTAYSPLPLPSLRRTVWAFIRCRTTTPAADFCRPVRMNRFTLSPDFQTNGRSPEVSSTAFRTQPPDLQPVPLMDMGFAVICPLARHRMPQIRFLYIGSYVCSTLLSDPPSPERPCASL